MSLATSCLIANLQIGTAAGADKAIVAAGAKVRYHFYANTLAWKMSSDRILPCKNFVAFMVGHLALKKGFAGLLTRVDVEIASKFYVRLDIDPVAQDFSVDLDRQVHDAVRARVAKAMEKRIALATDDLWSRLTVPLTHFAQKMESGETFRDATIKNLVEVVELMPRLNFADDPALATILHDCDIAQHLPKHLRTDKQLRANVAAEARRILAEIEKIRA